MKTPRAIVFVALALSPLLVASGAYAQDAASPARGYAYPVAWLLPLVVLIGTAAIGRALTRDLRKDK